MIRGLSVKSIFSFKKKDKKPKKTIADSSPPSPSPTQSVEDKFTFQTSVKPLLPSKKQDSSVPLGSGRERTIFPSTSGPSLSRPATSYFFTKVVIPYSIQDSEVLSEREKVDILLNHAQYVLTESLRRRIGSSRSRISANYLLNHLEENRQPIWINVEPGSLGPQVNTLQIRRQAGHKKHDSVEVGYLRRCPGQSIESFVVRGLRNALILDMGRITMEQASHNPDMPESQTDDLDIQYGTGHQFMRNYAQSSAKPTTGHSSLFEKPGATPAGYFGNAIPMNAPVHRNTQLRNLQELREGKLHPIGNPSEANIRHVMRQVFLQQMKALDRHYVPADVSCVIEKEREKSPEPALDSVESYYETPTLSLSDLPFSGEPSPSGNEASEQIKSSPYKKSNYPSLGSSEKPVETNLTFDKPSWQHRTTAKARDGAERDLAKARRSAKAMLPQQRSRAVDQPKTRHNLEYVATDTGP